jgi:hypothetical protein
MSHRSFTDDELLHRAQLMGMASVLAKMTVDMRQTNIITESATRAWRAVY